MDYEARFVEGAPIDEGTRMLVDLAKEMVKAADQAGKRYFFGSGLVIDLSLGKLTRNHHDLDFHPELADTKWWIEWFETRGFKVMRIEDGDYPETYKVVDSNQDEIVDLWPLELRGDVLYINKKGDYVDAGKQWNETRVVNFEGVEIRIENPKRVIEQKKRHVREGMPFRPQDKHDFELLGEKMEL